MDFELITKMNVNELKNYLKLCSLKFSGKDDELVALSMS